jgi:hypothetical protein
MARVLVIDDDEEHRTPFRHMLDGADRLPHFS